MKLKGFSPLGVKIEQFLSMKRLTYIHPLLPAVPNAIGFARETNFPFTSWSHDPFFED